MNRYLAVARQSQMVLEPASRLADDAVDFQLGVALPMTLVLLVVLAPAHLEDRDLVAATVRDDRRGDDGPGNDRLSKTHRCAGPDQQYLIEHNCRTHIRG